MTWTKAKINYDTHKNNIQYWKNFLICQHSKLFLKKHLGAAARNIFNINKRRLRTLVGTVIGYFSCNYHLNNLGLRQIKMFDRCNLDEETIHHLVCRCHLFQADVTECLGIDSWIPRNFNS